MRRSPQYYLPQPRLTLTLFPPFRTPTRPSGLTLASAGPATGFTTVAKGRLGPRQHYLATRILRPFSRAEAALPPGGLLLPAWCFSIILLPCSTHTPHSLLLSLSLACCICFSSRVRLAHLFIERSPPRWPRAAVPGRRRTILPSCLPVSASSSPRLCTTSSV